MSDEIQLPPTPWIYSKACKALDGDYYIGALVSEPVGKVICSIAHDGSKHSEDIVNMMLKEICDKFNE